jgi:uncharacterized membrane protein
MPARNPAARARENLPGLVSVLVTGIWLAALLTDRGWWLAFMLFGYVVLVPVTALLFGDREDVREWWDDETEAPEASAPAGDGTEDDALATLRDRYARGELTDEQFEHKLERLLETETLEEVEERGRDAPPERSRR